MCAVKNFNIKYATVRIKNVAAYEKRLWTQDIKGLDEDATQCSQLPMLSDRDNPEKKRHSHCQRHYLPRYQSCTDSCDQYVKCWSSDQTWYNVRYITTDFNIELPIDMPDKVVNNYSVDTVEPEFIETMKKTMSSTFATSKQN